MPVSVKSSSFAAYHHHGYRSGKEDGKGSTMVDYMAGRRQRTRKEMLTNRPTADVRIVLAGRCNLHDPGSPVGTQSNMQVACITWQRQRRQPGQ